MKINKKIFRNGAIWGTAKFDNETEFESELFRVFSTGWKITDKDTDEEIPEGLVRFPEENSDEE